MCLFLKKSMESNVATIKAKARKILKRHRVARAGIFGSYARGEAKKRSDIDIVVEIPDDKLDLIGFIRIKNELEHALGRRVDLVEYAALKSRLKERILKEEIAIV